MRNAIYHLEITVQLESPSKGGGPIAYSDGMVVFFAHD